jgi:hypothetical protein
MLRFAYKRSRRLSRRRCITMTDQSAFRWMTVFAVPRRSMMANVGQSIRWRLRVKTSTTHSPIRADQWSCGRVLLYLLDELETDDERLRAIGSKLKVHNSNQCPSLLEWYSWLPVPGPLLNMGNIERRASRLRQDSMVVNGGDTRSPNARKQRLALLH